MGVEERIADRSAETRQRLIEAALDLFAAQGFEGTTTRQLALRAKVNLAAIPYHFGSKERLYHAVAEYIVERIQARVLGGIARMPAEPASPAVARGALHQLMEHVADALLSAEVDPWAKFVMRELMAPTPAFEIFYQGVVEPAQNRICALVAASNGRSLDPQTLRAQGVMLFGQIAILRFAQPAARRRLGCTVIGPPEIARIKRVLRFNLDAILNAGGCP